MSKRRKARDGRQITRYTRAGVNRRGQEYLFVAVDYASQFEPLSAEAVHYILWLYHLT
jgi:hypothetical protein